MSYKSVQVTFSESDVLTLDELAKDLQKIYDWESWRISDTGAGIVFKAKDSEDGQIKEGYVGPSGFAFYLETDPDNQFEEIDEWNEYDVNWDEDFDGWSSYVWGENENGETVMVHN